MGESQEIKRRLDYQLGDLVEIVKGKHAGNKGSIITIRAATYKDILLYDIYLTEQEKTVFMMQSYEISFIKHSDE